VCYSVGVRAGGLFQINAPALAAPLIRELYREALDVGVHPFTRIGIDGLDALLYKHDSDAQIAYISPLAWHETEQIGRRSRSWRPRTPSRSVVPTRKGSRCAARPCANCASACSRARLRVS